MNAYSITTVDGHNYNVLADTLEEREKSYAFLQYSNDDNTLLTVAICPTEHVMIITIKALSSEE